VHIPRISLGSAPIKKLGSGRERCIFPLRLLVPPREHRPESSRRLATQKKPPFPGGFWSSSFVPSPLLLYPLHLPIALHTRTIPAPAHLCRRQIRLRRTFLIVEFFVIASMTDCIVHPCIRISRYSPSTCTYMQYSRWVVIDLELWSLPGLIWNTRLLR
jgi:hypothetical protein